MLDSALNLTVARAIPDDVIFGVLTGEYNLYGGVIRWAPGTAHAGQIVRHLVPVANTASQLPVFSPLTGLLDVAQLASNYQLGRQLSRNYQLTQRVLEVSQSTMMLSGFNLTVALVGFKLLADRLDGVNQRLTALEATTHAIRQFLERKERARFKAALGELLHIDEIADLDNRHTILHQTRQTFSELLAQYAELLEEAQTIELAMAHEEYFSILALARARCSSELEMATKAARELEDTKSFWETQARRIANDLLLGGNPERFLFSDYAEDVPTTALIEWLDFFSGQPDGYTHLDALRSQNKPRSLDVNFNWYGRGKNNTDRDWVIPSMYKLTKRNHVFEGHLSQYKYLAEQSVAVSEFEALIRSIDAQHLVDGFAILEPDAQVRGF